jgi:preprotein translocase SecE subunit
MSEKTKKKLAESRSRKPGKKARASLGSRLKKWFVNIITELKRVMWPDKKKLRQSTVTVLIIIAISVAIILAFDTVITFIMRTTGIYSTKDQTVDTDPEPSVSQNESAWRPVGSQGYSLMADGVKVTFEG